MKDRLLYLDFVKFIAIYLVVWGHAIQFSGLNDPTHDSVYEFIYAFHMPLFAIVSGHFLKNILLKPVVWNIKYKFLQLLLPVFSFSLLYFTFDILCCLTKISILGWVKMLVFDAWFLKALFISFVIISIFNKVFKNDVIVAVTSIIFIILIPKGTVFYTNFILPYLWIGYFFSKYWRYIEKYRFRILSVVTLLGGIGLCFWSIDYSIYQTPIKLIENGSIMWSNMGVMFYRFILGIILSLFLLLSVSFLETRSKSMKWYNYISQLGRYTLFIYLFQTYTVERNLLNFDFYFNKCSYDMVFTPIYSLFVIGIACWCAKFCEKSVCLSKLFLGKWK